LTTTANKHLNDPPDRLVGTAERRRRIPVSDMTIWRWEKAKIFPKHISIGGRNFWRDSDLRAVERGEYCPSSDAPRASDG
jgi:predicted DNA-binding transcriptional regulator AlpA